MLRCSSMLRFTNGIAEDAANWAEASGSAGSSGRDVPAGGDLNQWSGVYDARIVRFAGSTWSGNRPRRLHHERCA